MSTNRHHQDMPGLGLNSDTYKTCSWQRGCRAGLNHTSKSHGLLFLWTPSARLVLPQKYVLSARELNSLFLLLSHASPRWAVLLWGEG